MAGKGAPKGGLPGAGRPRGSASKPKAELVEMLREAYGPKFDAVVELAEIAHRLKGDHDPEQELRRIKCLETVARYTRPQLKAIEQTTTHQGAVDLRLDADELRAMAEFVHAGKADGG